MPEIMPLTFRVCTVSLSKAFHFIVCPYLGKMSVFENQKSTRDAPFIAVGKKQKYFSIESMTLCLWQINSLLTAENVTFFPFGIDIVYGQNYNQKNQIRWHLHWDWQERSHNITLQASQKKHFLSSQKYWMRLSKEFSQHFSLFFSILNVCNTEESSVKSVKSTSFEWSKKLLSFLQL